MCHLQENDWNQQKLLKPPVWTNKWRCKTIFDVETKTKSIRMTIEVSCNPYEQFKHDTLKRIIVHFFAEAPGACWHLCRKALKRAERVLAPQLATLSLRVSPGNDARLEERKATDVSHVKNQRNPQL